MIEITRLLWEIAEKAVSFFGDLLTIFASALAIYLYFTKRAELRAVLRTITTFANQSSLAEVRQKLEQLNSLNAADDGQRQEVVNIFHDICGQIDGNPLMREKFAGFATRARACTTNNRKPITEPQKRSLVSELREGLRHLDLSNHLEAVGDLEQ